MVPLKLPTQIFQGLKLQNSSKQDKIPWLNKNIYRDYKEKFEIIQRRQVCGHKNRQSF